MIGEFPTQRASNAENVSFWWCHHGVVGVHQGISNHNADQKLISQPEILQLFRDSGPRVNIKTTFPGMGIPMLKITRSWDRLIFNMGIPILVRWHLYIEMGYKCSTWTPIWIHGIFCKAEVFLMGPQWIFHIYSHFLYDWCGCTTGRYVLIVKLTHLNTS